MRIIRSAELTSEFYNKRNTADEDVRKIIDTVRERGDSALYKYAEKFDGMKISSLAVSPAAIKNAYESIDPLLIKSLELAAENIKRFAEKQRSQFTDFEMETDRGVLCGQKVVPVERICVYVPAGKYPLPSTVLMCAVPAVVAGVKEIAVVSPPVEGGTVSPVILAAGVIAGVKEFYCSGGAQAVAAFAYGTESIRKADKIVGPGNRYVAAAKKAVYGDTGIDFIAGPTELMIIADASAKPSFITADLIAQAEHDADAELILVTDSPELAREVTLLVDEKLNGFANRDMAAESLKNNGTIILVEKIEESYEIADNKAPEHLSLQMENAGEAAASLRNYGSLFIGEQACESLGDYSAGINHTLPTNGSSRFTGGLSVADFLKLQTTLRIEKSHDDSVYNIASVIASAEGLTGHKNAADIRRLLDS